MIKINNLSVSYTDKEKKLFALQNINLTIEKNSTCAVIGPSGCGKTTLIYALAGLLEKESGSIEIFGEKQNGIRKQTGLILQNYGLLPWKIVQENIALGLKVRGEDPKVIETKVNKILNKLDIEGLEQKYPAQLSGGQKQRVAIGRSLALSSDLLLMDEPSSSLDEISKEKLQNLILKLYKENQLTLVIVTHNIAEAVFLGQKIVVMKDSGIKDILDNPYFGDESLRYKMDFYKICLEVRKSLEKE
ncbi:MULTISPECIES: ABC transporter ATP-binding protein [unclassified Halanaerobium]|uniref:ABC transporter ATP-binding protein n=1 Tax=unclassified Halanaerobium TaxID=2641197 RepID=UPI000DF176D1|nr:MULTISPECIES: ATP-binding cassette domain-containing protein [unclassified Halanaerobium]RCW48726.1 NitT/TauT family transport system ATP-binding protein [Halanaerobium sp. MA284_MarDTE_T2]RCW89068.1 NitT/TauT family transport system ATP-binding protein [Halanaerobium sp. DL-01]